MAALTAGSAHAQHKAGTSLVVRTNSDFIVLDWQQRATQAVINYAWPLYDRLLAFDKTGTKVVNDIVTKWSATPVNRPKIYTFVLKPNVQCSDGHILTASDVKASFERFFSAPKISNQLPAWFGAGPYTLSANDKTRTFTFKLGTPFANAVYGFAQAGIICPAGLAALQSDPQALNKAAYGSGPYTLVSATHNDKVVYQKNPKWTWGPKGSNINKMPDSLTYQIIADPTTSANELLTGQIDLAPITGPDVARLASNSSLVHLEARNYYPMPLTFNQDPSRITADDTVRKALMTAINPKDFATATGWSNPIVHPSYLNPVEKCFEKDIAKYAPTGGPAKAQQIMKAAGWTLNGNGVFTKNGKTATVKLVTSVDIIGGGGQYLAQQFKAAGFDVNLSDGNSTVYSSQVVAGNYDAAVSFSYQYFPGPFYNLALYYGAPPPTGGNFGHVGGNDVNYERAAIFAQGRTDCPWSYKLQKIMLQDHVSYPLAQQVSDSFGNKKWNFPDVVPSLEIEWVTQK